MKELVEVTHAEEEERLRLLLLCTPELLHHRGLLPDVALGGLLGAASGDDGGASCHGFEVCQRGRAGPAAALPVAHSVSRLRWSHHVGLMDAILGTVMNRLFPVLLGFLAACVAPTGGDTGSAAVLSVQPSGQELKSELSSFVVSTSPARNFF